MSTHQMEDFDGFLDELINKIIEKRPQNAYDELIFGLYNRLSPELRQKNPTLNRFGQNFKSEISWDVPRPNN